MKKSVLRVLCVFAAVLLAAAFFLPSGALLTAEAAGEPVFSLESDAASARTGDIVTISVYIDNPTSSSVSNFDGVISFNSKHLSYVDFSFPKNMKNRLTCIDSSASSASAISIAYADTTKSIIAPDTTHLLIMQLRFEVVSTISGNGLVSFKINSWNGSTSGSMGVAQIFITVSPTQPAPTTTSTTTSTTTTTTTGSTGAPTTNQRSSDARLQALSVTPGTLSPEFNPEFVAYTVNVEYEIATVRISATTSSNTAVISGAGIKDLAVGQNAFTLTVTAEDGTSKQYGVVVIRGEETAPSVDIQIDTPSTIPTLPSDYILEPVAPDATTTAATLPAVTESNKVIEGGSDVSADTSLAKIIGIIFAEVALFMFGFLAGFFLDKNIKKKNLAELTYGPLDQQPRIEYIPAPPPQPQQQEYYPEYPPQPEYQPQPEYTEYTEYTEYPNYAANPPAEPGYTDDGFPQYSTYETPAYDEYGNPISNDQQYGGYPGYSDGSDTYYT